MKKPIARPLHYPSPLTLTINWRERRRSSIRRRGEHPHQTAWGDFWLTLAANAGLCQPERTINTPVRRQDAIAPNASTTSAQTSHLRDQGHTAKIRAGGRGRVGKRRGAKGQRQWRGEPRRRRRSQREKHHSRQKRTQ